MLCDIPRLCLVYKFVS